jgi:hypothetical protein
VFTAKKGLVVKNNNKAEKMFDTKGKKYEISGGLGPRVKQNVQTFNEVLLLIRQSRTMQSCLI